MAEWFGLVRGTVPKTTVQIALSMPLWHEFQTMCRKRRLRQEAMVAEALQNLLDHWKAAEAYRKERHYAP